MPLLQSRSDPRGTGITIPGAYGVVTSWHLQSETNVNVFTLAWYADTASYQAGLQPFDTETVVLNDAERGSGLAALMSVLYGILAARPEYADAEIVA